MRRWGMWLLLVGIAFGLLISMELHTDNQADLRTDRVRLTTHTPTATRTAGWWAEVATWTATASAAAGTDEPTGTPMATGTPTPYLPTVVLPTLRPTWTEGPR